MTSLKLFARIAAYLQQVKAEKKYLCPHFPAANLQKLRPRLSGTAIVALDSEFYERLLPANISNGDARGSWFYPSIHAHQLKKQSVSQQFREWYDLIVVCREVLGPDTAPDVGFDRQHVDDAYGKTPGE